ncbi:hypothetical protein GZL_06336 [Streptomyces sp. 769]|nr:hypothetical protein GZL_06336 [Streptomyces sp. 769]
MGVGDLLGLHGEGDRQPSPLIGLALGRRPLDGLLGRDRLGDVGQLPDAVRGEPDHRLLAQQRVPELLGPLGPERGQVEPRVADEAPGARRVPGRPAVRRTVHRHGRLGRLGRGEPVDAVDPEAGAGGRGGDRFGRPRHGPGREIPDARLEHEAVRLQLPGHLAAGPEITGRQPPVVPHRVGDHRQQLGRLGVVVPARRVQVEPLGGARRGVPKLRQQRGGDLQPGRGPDVGQTHLPQRGGHSGQEERLRLAAAEPGQPGAVAAYQAVAPGPAAVRVDGHPGLRERQHVPGDRALRDLQLPRQLPGRHRRPGLEQQHHSDQPCGTHGSIMRGSTDNAPRTRNGKGPVRRPRARWVVFARECVGGRPSEDGAHSP